MRVLFLPRQAALLGVMLGVAGCDIVSFVQDPLPRFEQTWNVPAESTTISVARLLPSNVSIYSTPGVTPEDSIAFRVDIGPTTFSRRLGDDCGPCQALDGLTVIKPAFALATGGMQGLPTDIVSGSLLGGTSYARDHEWPVVRPAARTVHAGSAGSCRHRRSRRFSGDWHGLYRWRHHCFPLRRDIDPGDHAVPRADHDGHGNRTDTR